MRDAPIRLAFVALLLLVLPAAARDKTVGLCTLKDNFAKAQKSIDRLIVKLTAAAGEKEKLKLGKSIAKKHGRGAKIECLIRYRENDMRYVLLPLLAEKRWQIRTRALYALKMVGDASLVPEVAKSLRDKDARVREMAANCLCHIAAEVPAALREAHEREKDRFARASMAAALAVLESGDKPYDAWEEKLTGPEGARRVEWAWTVKGKSSFNRYDARTSGDSYPAANSFDWPISWYEGSLFAPVPRKSFGAGGNHAGEDMAWFREGCSYHAIAPRAPARERRVRLLDLRPRRLGHPGPAGRRGAQGPEDRHGGPLLRGGERRLRRTQPLRHRAGAVPQAGRSAQGLESEP
jgi:hypothetical protein